MYVAASDLPRGNGSASYEMVFCTFGGRPRGLAAGAGMNSALARAFFAFLMEYSDTRGAGGAGSRTKPSSSSWVSTRSAILRGPRGPRGFSGMVTVLSCSTRLSALFLRKSISFSSSWTLIWQIALRG